MPKATWNGAVIAEASEDAVEVVEGNVYFPAASVRRDCLQPSDTHTVCGWKGTASYYHVAVDGELNLQAFRTHLISCLPSYARPLFLRIQSELQVTATFKQTKNDLAREGYDPAATSDAIYLNDPERQAFVQIDNDIHNRIQIGLIPL